MTPEQETNLASWVAALRSGQYHQTQQALRKGDAYCCLGVACELYRQATGQGEWVEPMPSVSWEFMVDGHVTTAVLPVPVQEWLGLRNDMGHYDDGRLSLSSHNDHGASFAEIADIIEAHRSELVQP